MFAPNLKLQDDDFVEPLAVSPEKLLEAFSHGFVHLHQLLKDFNCTEEDLMETLADPAMGNHLKLQFQLTSYQLKLLSLQYAPHALARTVELADTAEKPEVARRCAATVMQMAGIPTCIASPEPQPVIDPQTKKAHTNPVNEKKRTFIMRALYWALNLQLSNIDITKIPREVVEDIFKAVKDPKDLFNDPENPTGLNPALAEKLQQKAQERRESPPQPEEPQGAFNPFTTPPADDSECRHSGPPRRPSPPTPDH